MFCSQCGNQNSPGSNFCSACGAALVEVLEDPTATFAPVENGDSGDEEEAINLEGVPVGAPVLIVKRGANVGSYYTFDKPTTTAGRNPDSDIFLDDITVSRRHAEFTRDGSDLTVKDAGSLNGTYVNRERVDSRQLAHGDEVQIGKYKLLFIINPG